MLEDGLGYPVRGEWIGRIIIGGVLGFFSFLVVPGFVLLGYLYRVLELTVRGEDTPPQFERWGYLLGKGVGTFAIMVVYAVVPLLVWVAILTLVVGGILASSNGGGAFGGLRVLTVVLMFPVVLFVYWTMPAAISNYAHDGNLGAAFEFSSIFEVVFTFDYVAATLLPMVVAFVLWVVTFLVAITVVGLLFVPFIQFYGQVAVIRMFGVAYEARSSKTRDQTGTTATA